MNRARKILKIEIEPNSLSVYINEQIIAIDNNEIIENKPNHRRWIHPGDDFSKDESLIQLICSALHTNDAISTYRESTRTNAEVVQAHKEKVEAELQQEVAK